MYTISKSKRGEFTPSNISNHIIAIKNSLYRYKIEGFVSSSFYHSNSLYQIIFDIFKKTLKFSTQQIIFELEHWNNLFLLLLYKDLLILKSTFNQDEADLETLELFHSLMSERVLLFNQLSGSIRKNIKLQRVCFNNRIYIGFDSEFETIEYGKNKLLAFSTATYCRFVFRIKRIVVNFDTNVTPQKDFVRESIIGSHLYTLIYGIRVLLKKEDLAIEILSRYLDNFVTLGKLDKIDSINEFIYFVKKEIMASSFITSFHDLRTDNSIYSLLFILNQGKKDSTDVLKKEYEFFSEILFKLDVIEIVFTKTTLKINELSVVRGRDIIFLIAHFSVADISSLKDFESFKEKLSIILKTYVTIERPLSVNKTSIFIRDTSLLSVNKSSLKDIGDLYPQLPKKDIGDNIKTMSVFYKNNPNDFRDYAIQDSVLALYHALMIENTVVATLKRLSIPVTLSSFAGNYLETKVKDVFKIPSDNPKYNIKNISDIYTPVGIESTGELNEFLPYFLGSYHGGRNECFIYGLCTGTFYDYDLPAAYPTGMSLLGKPDFSNSSKIGEMSGEDFKLNYKNILNSFTGLKIKFKFPDTCKYPNLPVRLDDSTLIFPLEGISFCTGIETLLALDLGCDINILNGYFIPFMKKYEDLVKNEEELHGFEIKD
jgi:hypothetical protein